MEVREAAQAVQSTQLAIKHAVSGECGPIALLYHSTALTGRVGPDTVPSLYGTRPYLPGAPVFADPKAVAAAVAVLRDAERPVIIAGSGVRFEDARTQLQILSNSLKTPVATTASGKGAFPEDHEMSVGVFGTFGLAAANAVVGEADVILVVGSKLAPSDTARENPDLIDPLRQILIQIDIEPKNAGWTFPCDHVLIGNAANVLSRINDGIRDSAALSESVLKSRKDRVQAARKAHGFFDAPSLIPTARRFFPSGSSKRSKRRFQTMRLSPVTGVKTGCL